MGLCDIVAGISGGVAGLFIGHPFDTVKVRQQVHKTGVLDTIRIIHRDMGLKGFYRGVGPPIITSGFQQGIFFGIYGATMDFLIERRRQIIHEQAHLTYEERKERAKKNAAYYRIKPMLKETEYRVKATYLDCFTAGTTAGFVRLITSCPVEVIKTRMQTQKGKAIYKNSFECLKWILKTQGIRGLFVGGVPLSFRAYGLGIYTVLYEELKVNLPVHNLFLKLFLAGGTAGLIQWWLVLPLDVVKSRLQADDVSNPKYKGFIDCIKKLYKSEGFSAFHRGFVPLSLRAFPVNGATFLTYEIVYRFCKKHSEIHVKD